MGTPLVTISSAFYNTGPILLDMVKSVFAQTFTDWELLLINDGSTDESLAIAESVDDPRVRIYSNDRNRGRSFSLNRITELARGKYIARMDSDDLCSPTRIEKQVRLLESNPRLDAVSAGVIYLDKEDNPTGDMVTPGNHDEICRTPWRTIHLVHGALMAKREFFQAYPYRQELRMAVDFNIFLRSHARSVFGNVQEPLYYYRLDTSFNLKKQFAARRYSASFLFDYYRQNRGWFAGLRYAANQYLKFAATLAMFATGQRDKMMAKRFNGLDTAKIESYRDELNRIKSFPLPLKTRSGARTLEIKQ
jgi:glycosyltransferase involved in cell wall biosynthesis